MLRFAIVMFAALAAPAWAAMPPGLDEGCKPVFGRYEQSAGPKAFAAGRTRGCGWQSGGGRIADIQAQALRQCQANGGDGCRVVASVATGAGQLSAQGRTPQCEQAYDRYSAAPGPKAFAQGASGSCGWQVQTGQLRTAQEIQARALAQCRSEGGQNCRIVNAAK